VIKLKDILESVLWPYKGGKEFESKVHHWNKVWRAIVSPAIRDTTDNPNHWPFRVTIFSIKRGEYTSEDHFYVASDDDTTILGNLKDYEIDPWERIR
jgi:hypothetical protein